MCPWTFSGRSIPARSRGFHHRDMAFGARCGEAWNTAPFLVHTLRCALGGMQTRIHQAILRRFLMHKLREHRIPHVEESATPFKDWTSHGHAYLRIEAVTDHGGLFQERADFKSASSIVDFMVAILEAALP